MKKLALLLFLVTLHFLAKAQNDSIIPLKVIDTLQQNARDMAIDNLGNIYLLSATNQIKKINANGDSIGVYNDVRRYGNIYSIDVTSPLKVVVYYRDYATIIVLDRFLNVLNTIDLRKLNILQARVVATSYDNNFWVYDDLDNKLKKINDNGDLLLESSDYRQAFDPAPVPVNLFDRDGLLYLVDANRGIIVLDYYGAKKNKWDFKGITNAEVIDRNTILISDNKNTYLFKPAFLQQIRLVGLPDSSNCNKLSFYNGHVYCLRPDGKLAIYQLQ